jgi:hypothetical protein
MLCETRSETIHKANRWPARAKGNSEPDAALLLSGAPAAVPTLYSAGAFELSVVSNMNSKLDKP